MALGDQNKQQNRKDKTRVRPCLRAARRHSSGTESEHTMKTPIPSSGIRRPIQLALALAAVLSLSHGALAAPPTTTTATALTATLTNYTALNDCTARLIKVTAQTILTSANGLTTTG